MGAPRWRWRMKSKDTALWILFLIGVGIAAAGFILTPDFLVASLTSEEVAKLSGREISALRALRVVLIGGGLLLAVLSIALRWLGGRVARRLVGIFQLESQTLEGASGVVVAFDLFLVSFLGLFFEILIIRWLSTEIRLFAYYKNLPLIAAFMGLGIGFMLARKKLTLLPVFPIAFCALSSIVLVGAATGVFTSLSNRAGHIGNRSPR